MRITAAQLDRFRSQAEQTYRSGLVAHGAEFFLTVYDVCGDAGLELCVDLAVEGARAREFTGRACVQTWFDMQMLLGADFDSDPLLAFLLPHLDWEAERQRLADRDPENQVGTVSDDADPDPIDMMDRVHADAWAWIDRTAGENYGNLYRALARLGVLLSRDDLNLPDDPPGLIKAFERVFPEKAAALETPAINAFLTAAAIRAAQDGFAAGEGRSLYILRCFVGGIGAFHDPAYAIDGRPCADQIPAAPAEARAEAHRRYVIEYIRRLLESARRHGAEGV